MIEDCRLFKARMFRFSNFYCQIADSVFVFWKVCRCTSFSLFFSAQIKDADVSEVNETENKKILHHERLKPAVHEELKQKKIKKSGKIFIVFLQYKYFLISYLTTKNVLKLLYYIHYWVKVWKQRSAIIPIENKTSEMTTGFEKSFDI